MGVGFGGDGAVAQDEPDLPQQIGAVNDYAASLGRQTREGLQTQIDRLRSEANVDVAVLISLIDPFGDPARYAESIWNEWGLGSERTVLLVYVREGGERWAFRVRASSDVSSRLSGLRLGATRTAIDDALADGDVAEAVRIAVDALAERWAPGTPASSGEPGDADPSGSTSTSNSASPTDRSPWWGSVWVWIGGGALVVLIGIGGLIWAMLVWFCPRCGARLQKRTESSTAWDRVGRGRSSRSVYYCPSCRYVRRLRKRSTQRRRTRGERRRAAGRRY